MALFVRYAMHFVILSHRYPFLLLAHTFSCTVGTAVACVYAVMVAYIISDWESEIARNLFIGGAVVLIQIPACYVRSYPLYSYSGTVTGFTVAMLLLTSNATTAFAVNRIIDTYVGVTIYMVLEFLAAATFTEDEIISDMRQVSNLLLYFFVCTFF